MKSETVQALFGWCATINIALLIWWFLFFWLAHDAMYQFHSRLFEMSVATFDAIQYAGLALFKIGIFLFNLGPYLAMRIVGRSAHY